MPPPSHPSWTTAFITFTSDIPQGHHTRTTTTSAQWLRSLMASGLFQLTDLRDRPDRFLDAHRLLSQYAIDVGPALGIRMTVQYNLFAGTVLGCGNPTQIESLVRMQQQGELGCFALTEAFAGVHSGLVVQTTATFAPHPDHGAPGFVLHCPDEGARKNWISQGMVADWMVVIADLRVPRRNASQPSVESSTSSSAPFRCGPHAFLVRLRHQGGPLPKEVTATNMGQKTVGNDLDNAQLTFHHWWIPLHSLLNRYAQVTDTGKYIRTTPHLHPLEAVGQRLHTGRAVIATSAVEFARALYRRTREYTDTKACWTPVSASSSSTSSSSTSSQRPSLTLSNVPQLHTLYAQMDRALTHCSTQMRRIDGQLRYWMRRNECVPSSLVDTVAAAKVHCVETAIHWCHRLQQEVGSYALSARSGFGQLGYLQCCKFAEGDSRVLLHKLARDRYIHYVKHEKGQLEEDFGGANAIDTEVALCWELDSVVQLSGWEGWAMEQERVERLGWMVVGRWMGGEEDVEDDKGEGEEDTEDKKGGANVEDETVVRSRL